ncbi:YgaP family membrane protein [Flavobacterium pallidum]|nr:DUF2892 domain-containing protein [Flavobacterium pallidum]
MSTPDKFIRTTIGGLLVLLMYLCDDDRAMQWASGVSGIYLILTSLLGTCIVYAFLDVSTLASKNKKRFY